jgi:hypothetical protein
MIGRLVCVLKHLHAAHRGQRDPQIAVDRADLLRLGKVKRQLAIFNPQHRHPVLPARRWIAVTSCPPAAG